MAATLECLPDEVLATAQAFAGMRKGAITPCVAMALSRLHAFAQAMGLRVGNEDTSRSILDAADLMDCNPEDTAAAEKVWSIKTKYAVQGRDEGWKQGRVNVELQLQDTVSLLAENLDNHGFRLVVAGSVGTVYLPQIVVSNWIEPASCEEALQDSVGAVEKMIHAIQAHISKHCSCGGFLYAGTEQCVDCACLECETVMHNYVDAMKYDTDDV